MLCNFMVYRCDGTQHDVYAGANSDNSYNGKAFLTTGRRVSVDKDSLIGIDRTVYF
jgi:hypothetical protein